MSKIQDYVEHKFYNKNLCFNGFLWFAQVWPDFNWLGPEWIANVFIFVILPPLTVLIGLATNNPSMLWMATTYELNYYHSQPLRLNRMLWMTTTYWTWTYWTTATTTTIQNALLWMAQCMGKIGHFCSRGLFTSVVMNTTEHYPRIRKSIRILPHFKISANFVYKTKTNCWHDSSRPLLVLY